MKLILTLIFVASSLCGWTQAPDISVEWGPIQKTKESNFQSFIGADENHFYTLGSEARGLISMMMNSSMVIKKYDRKSFRLLDNWVVKEFDYKGKEANLDRAIFYNGEIHLYYKIYNTKLDKKFLILRKLDEKGRLSKPEEMASLNAEKRSEGRFDLVTSQDSTKMLLYTDIPTEKKEKEKFGLQVFDRNNASIWEKQISLPYTDKFFSVEDYVVTNNGDVLLLGYAMPDKYKGEKKERKSSNRSYKMLMISSEENAEIEEFDLDMGKKYIHSLSIRADFDNGTMALAGFYSDEDEDDIGGSLLITLDQQTLEVKTNSTLPFTKEFLTNFMSERKAEKGRELGRYVFRNFIRRNDGGVVLVAEQHYVYTVTTHSANGTVSTTTYYVYNDIIVLNISPEGNLDWAAHIPKYQKTADDGGFYNGYLLQVEGDRLHFIYNDHRKNLDRKADGKKIKSMGAVTKTVSIIATIDKNGTVSYDQLFRNKDFNAILVPRKSFATNDSKILIYGRKGGKTRFGKLGFL